MEKIDAAVPRGERLRAFRLQKGLSLQGVAEASGLGLSYVFRIESGKTTNPGIERFRQLANALEVPIDYLVGDLVQGPVSLLTRQGSFAVFARSAVHDDAFSVLNRIVAAGLGPTTAAGWNELHVWLQAARKDLGPGKE